MNIALIDRYILLPQYFVQRNAEVEKKAGCSTNKIRPAVPCLMRKCSTKMTGSSYQLYVKVTKCSFSCGASNLAERETVTELFNLPLE